MFILKSRIIFRLRTKALRTKRDQPVFCTCQIKAGLLVKNRWAGGVTLEEKGPQSTNLFYDQIVIIIFFLIIEKKRFFIFF